MTNFVARYAGLATLVLAALPVASLATNAHAAPMRIRVSDIDLTTAEGMAKFEARAKSQEDRFCHNGAVLSGVAACRMAVRAELAEKVDHARQSQLAAKARNTTLAAAK